MGRKPLYLYFDESGDLNFRESGTSYYLFGVLVTRDPWPLVEALGHLRKTLYEGAFIPEYFHASEDLQEVRDKVFATICETAGFVYDVMIVEKNAVPDEFQERHTFYTFVADFVLRQTLARHPNAEPVYLTTDTIPVKRKRASVIKGFKQCLSNELDNRRYEIGHHSSSAHACLQAADYLNWALFRKWERDDLRSYDLIQGFVRSETKLDWSILK